MRFAFINNGGGLVTHVGKWSSKAPCIESWAHLLDADFFSGVEGIQQTWESLNQYDVIMVNQNNTMFDLTCKIKENCKHPFLIAVAEGSACNIGHFGNIELCSMIRAAQACDMYGILVDWAAPYYQSITSKPVRWIGIPFYKEFFEPHKINPSEKDRSLPIIGLQNALGDGRNGVLSLLVASKVQGASILLPCLQAGWEELLNTLDIKNVRPFNYLGWVDYIKKYKQAYLCIHLDSLYTYGRFPLDMAALGIPVVGSNRNQSQILLWPGLTVDPIKEIKKAESLVHKLINNQPFYVSQTEYAREAIAGFTPEKAKTRLLNIITNLTGGKLKL